MKNKAYIVINEGRYNAMVKIGFTSDLDRRIMAYKTHNPMAKVLGYIETQKRTNRRMETAIHNFMKRKGYQCTTNAREWYVMNYEDELYQRIIAEGFCAFGYIVQNHKYTELERGE